jgi:Ser/Thr protein kinase RdoA (MazF antagonist)
VQSALAAWGELAVVGPLGGGKAQCGTGTGTAARGRERLVARRSRRSPASLDWEIDLLGHLARHGVRVPVIVPSSDNRRHVDGVVVRSWLEGSPPGPGDWAAVAAVLRQLHEVTAGWPQRPEFASTRELLTTYRGGHVDLSVMPADAVTACRAAWRRLAGRPETVVHGDPGPAEQPV